MSKHTNLLLVILSSLLFTLCSVNSQAQDVTEIQPLDSLSLNLYFDTTDYLYGQNIIAYVSLINYSDRPIRVTEIRSNWSSVTIDDESGTQLSMRNADWRFGKKLLRDAVMQLASNDSLTTTFLLCYDYGLAYEVAIGEPCIAVGETLIRANYLNRMFTPYTSVKVALPTGEESVAYELYHRAAVLSRTQGYEPCISVLDSLIAEHRDSRYIPEACKLAIWLGTAAIDSMRVFNFGKRLIGQFPNHPYACEAVDRIPSFTTDTAYAIQFCDSIATAYPNTRVGARALGKLASLKAEKP